MDKVLSLLQAKPHFSQENSSQGVWLVEEKIFLKNAKSLIKDGLSSPMLIQSSGNYIFIHHLYRSNDLILSVKTSDPNKLKEEILSLFGDYLPSEYINV